jgi:hypothetical protein
MNDISKGEVSSGVDNFGGGGGGGCVTGEIAPGPLNRAQE